MENLAEVLSHYGIKGKVVRVNQGPLVKQIEFLPEAGTKLKNITASLHDIARELGVSSLRVEAVKNSNNLGFEVPAEEMKTVDFKKIIDSDAFTAAKGTLPLCLGVDIAGKPVFADLAKMPHLLVAGTTGSGKSVGLNTFIMSLIKTKTPAELKFILIDPKRIEFGIYNNQQYMLAPVVTDNALAAKTLQYLAQEMERRYGLFEENFSKNIGDYNAKGEALPYIVCVIDEFADLAASDSKVEKIIQQLAQKSRAAGIHIILATQRPSVDVVTGVLKANFPTRLAYKVASAADSRTILDMAGAENLLGRGDALFLPQDGEIKRIHGAYIDDAAIAGMLEPYRANVKPLPVVQEEKEASGARAVDTNGQKPGQPSVWRRLLNWWSSLRVRERKTIVAAIIAGFNFLLKREASARPSARRRR